MARKPRFVIPDLVQHVTQRGNDGCPIFRTIRDRIEYLQRVILFANLFRIRILAYVLMTNHVHFALIVPSQLALSKFIQRLHSEHATRMNERYGWTGHLFGERFYSGSVDHDAAFEVIRYVELNPVRAGMIALAQDFEFSSARAHVLAIPDPVLGRVWEPLSAIDDHAAWLAEVVPDAEERNEVIREFTRRGKRITADAFRNRRRPRRG